MQLMMALVAQKLRTVNSERGQATVEYIIVTVAAGALAVALFRVTNAMTRITSLFNWVIDYVVELF